MDDHNGHGFTKHLDLVYDRAKCIVGPGTYEAPEGRKVVVLEGVKAVKIINELRQHKNISGQTIFIQTLVQDGIQGAVNRDVEAKSRSPENARNLRRKEAKHFEQSLKEELLMADVVLVRGKK